MNSVLDCCHTARYDIEENSMKKCGGIKKRKRMKKCFEKTTISGLQILMMKTEVAAYIYACAKD
jgi:hypothetical protein